MASLSACFVFGPPGTSSACAMRLSSVPYCCSHFAAVFGPTPGTPGTLSTESPTSAWKSMTWSGRTPQSVSIPAASSISPSLRRLRIFTFSVTSCRQSLSVVQRKTSSPRAAASLGDRRHDVVGLEPRHDQERDPHRLQHLLDERFLDEQVVRRRVAVGLVVRVDLVAEGRVLVVEGGDQVVGAAVVEVHERARDAEDGVGRPAVGGGHRPDAVEHLEDQPVGVEQVQTARGGRVRHWMGNLVAWAVARGRGSEAGEESEDLGRVNDGCDEQDTARPRRSVKS